MRKSTLVAFFGISATVSAFFYFKSPSASVVNEVEEKIESPVKDRSNEISSRNKPFASKEPVQDFKSSSNGSEEARAVSSSDTKSRPQEVEQLTELSGVNRHFTTSAQNLQSQFDLLMKSGAHTPESIKIYQHFIDRLGDPRPGIEAYQKAISERMSEKEVQQLLEINSNPVVAKFNQGEEASEQSYSEYTDFMKKLEQDRIDNPTKVDQRLELIDKLYNKLQLTNHTLNMTKGALQASAKLLNQPELAEAALEMTPDILDQAGKMAMYYRLRGFSEDELGELLKLKGSRVAVKEEAIKQEAMAGRFSEID